GVERKWRFARHTVEKIFDELRVEKVNSELSIRRYKRNYRRKTVWFDKEYNANIYGTQLLSKIIEAKFPYPKSLFTTKECLSSIAHGKNATFLDFFSGSGTTGHAVLELNKEDGGNRKFILCT